MATWMLTADAQLLNLDAVEFIEVMDYYPEDADPEDVQRGRVEAINTELVAHLGSGEEVLLFDDEDPEVVMHAFELLKAHLAAGPLFDAARGAQIVSVRELVERAGSHKN